MDSYINQPKIDIYMLLSYYHLFDHSYINGHFHKPSMQNNVFQIIFHITPKQMDFIDFP